MSRGKEKPVYVIIIGAGRSGTNMLRNNLCFFDGVATWPCDEINYIWRYGNASWPTDEFTPEMASARTKRYIRRRFTSLQKRMSADVVVEKTCANSLRVGFVNAVFPEALFVHIVRDARDVAVSANERWHAALDIPYLLRKGRYVPFRDLPYYGAMYMLNRLEKLFSSDNRLSTWGPRFTGMDEVICTRPEHVACAIQWKKCVDRALCEFEGIEPGRVFHLKYEDFVREPRDCLRRVMDFAGIEADGGALQEAVKNVSTRSIGRWKGRLSTADRKAIESECGACLRRLGYL